MSGLKRYLFPQGIAGQVTGILVVALMLSQVLAAAVYVLLAPQWEMRLRPRLVAAKIVTVVRIIESLPVEQRQTATIAAGSNFSFANSAISSSQAAVTPVGSQDDRFGQWIAAGIDRAQGDIAVTAGPTDSSVSTTRVEIPLRGGGWLTVSVNSQDTLRLGTLQQFAAFGFLFITIGGVAIWLTQRVVSPLSQLADAAEQFGLKGEAPPLPEQGPMEVRRAARTFNLMQERLRRFVEDRTRMLAAISHDLRTPLTRLRLRVETDESADQHGKMLHDIKMMEEMLTSTLAFTRDAEEMETAESVDLASLLQTICDDFADSGAEISFDGPRHQAFYCRPQLLMRAMSNLIGNAAKYGNSVVVRLRPDAGKGIVIVDIEDDGPGIPDAEKERVFEPFYRLDPARGVDSGGIGLGLAIARTIILSHGGEIRLLDRQPGGLIARVIFPDEKRARDHADFGARLATDHEGGPFREAKATIKKRSCSADPVTKSRL